MSNSKFGCQLIHNQNVVTVDYNRQVKLATLNQNCKLSARPRVLAGRVSQKKCEQVYDTLTATLHTHVDVR